MNQAKISVIIPVFNVESYLRQCLDSVISQTLKEIEIICINDGSTDHSLKILNDYASKDNRITIIDNKKKGQGFARNIAIKKASGEYLSFVDSDDWIDINMFQELYESAKQFSSDVTICEFELYNPKTGIISQPAWTKIPITGKFDNHPFHWSDIPETLFLINSGPWNKIFKTDLINSIDAGFAEGLNFEDILFVFKCILNAKTMTYIRKPLYVNRYLRPGSITSSRGKKQFDIFNVLQLLENEIYQDKKLTKIRIRFQEYKVSQFFDHLNQVTIKYKKQFWDCMKFEFTKLDKETNDYLLKHNAKFRIAMKNSLFYYQTHLYSGMFLNFLIRLR